MLHPTDPKLNMLQGANAFQADSIMFLGIIFRETLCSLHKPVRQMLPATLHPQNRLFCWWCLLAFKINLFCFGSTDSRTGIHKGICIHFKYTHTYIYRTRTKSVRHRLRTSRAFLRKCENYELIHNAIL